MNALAELWKDLEERDAARAALRRANVDAILNGGEGWLVDVGERCVVLLEMAANKVWPLRFGSEGSNLALCDDNFSSLLICYFQSL